MVSFRNVKRIADKARDQVDKRGGSDALKQDADELKSIAKGKGSLTDKAKAAGKAIKDPGAPGGTEGTPGSEGVDEPKG